MLRDALRSLRHSPGTTVFILAILTVVIAAATVTFSVVDAVVLRPLPFPDPGSLIVLEHQGGVISQARSFSAADYLALQEHLASSATVAAVTRTQLTLKSEDSTTEKIVAARVTASLWDVLAVRPELGQTFAASEEVSGAAPVGVISHQLWMRRFGRDRGFIGKPLT